MSMPKSTEEPGASPEALRARIRELEDQLADLRVQMSPDCAPLIEFIHALPQVVFEADLTGKFRRANQYGLERFGYTPDDLQHGISVMDVIIPEYHAQAAQRMQEAFRDRNVSAARYTARCRDGSTFPCLIHSRPLFRNGQPSSLVGVLVDITDLHLAEERLASDAARTEAILRTIPDIIFLLDEDGTYLDILTTKDEKLYRDRHLLIGKRLHDVLPASVADIALYTVREAVESGQSRVVEYQLDVPAGGLWFEGRTAVVGTDEQGKRQVVFAAHDITTRKQAEISLAEAHDMLERRVEARTQELAQSEARYRLLFETSRDIVITTDTKGRITSLSPAFRRLSGLASSDWIGRSYLELLHPEDAVASEKVLKAIVEGEKHPRGTRRRGRTAAGDYKTFDVLSAPLLHEGEVVGVMATLRDVSERAKAEDALRDSEERYRSLVEAAPDIVFVLDGEGRFAALNSAFEKIVGFPSQDWIGRSPLELVHPEDYAEAKRRIQTVLTDATAMSFTLRISTASGACVVMDVTMSPQQKNGEVIGIVGIARDFTERKRTEEALMQSERMAAVGTLSAGIAHEFNNIHTTILGFLELVLEDELNESARPLIERVHRASRRASGVTRNLLAFSRPEKGQRLLKDLNAIIEEILQLLRSEFVSQGVELHWTPSNKVLANTDSVQVGQVVMNLLINAYHATLGSEVRRIELTTGRQGEDVFIRVSDSGCGIPREQIGRIFLPFFSTKGEHAPGGAPQHKVRGTGLGLSICDTIARNLGGRIEVESRVGEGSTFTLWLPGTEKLAGVHPSTETPRPVLADKRILILDDEEDVRLLLADVLERTADKVVATDDGEAALAAHVQSPFDLALVDIQMPKLDGHEFLRRVRELPNPPVCVVITGKLDPAETLNLADEYVVHKPFELNALYAMLADAVSPQRDP